MSSNAPVPVSCLRCQHHRITHEVAMRYECRALGFKSATLPCRVVLQNSGMDCQYFLARSAPTRGI